MAATVPAPSVSVADLAAYVGVAAADADGMAHLEAVHAETLVLVADVFATAWRDVPQKIVNQVFKDVGHETYKRRDSPSGASQYATMDGPAPARAPRDPFHQSWPIIRRYVVPL